MRPCAYCCQNRNEAEFLVDPRQGRLGGRCVSCRENAREETRRYRAKDPDRWRRLNADNNRRWRERHREKLGERRWRNWITAELARHVEWEAHVIECRQEAFLLESEVDFDLEALAPAERYEAGLDIEGFLVDRYEPEEELGYGIPWHGIRNEESFRRTVHTSDRGLAKQVEVQIEARKAAVQEQTAPAEPEQTAPDPQAARPARRRRIRLEEIADTGRGQERTRGALRRAL